MREDQRFSCLQLCAQCDDDEPFEPDKKKPCERYIIYIAIEGSTS